MRYKYIQCIEAAEKSYIRCIAMTKKQNKIGKSFRLDRSVIALMETYARDNQMTNTDVVELAIKRLCRQSATPATQQDIAALAEMIRTGQAATLAAIENQPIQIAGAIEEQQPKRRGLLGWLRG